MRELTAEPRTYPIRGVFRISRGEKRTATVIEVAIQDGDRIGRGECVPYARYGQTTEGVLADIGRAAASVAAGATIAELQHTLPAGPARNAIECALWDLQGRAGGPSSLRLFTSTGPAQPVVSAFTLSLDTPEAMGAAAAAAAAMPVLKLKLGGDGDVERVRAVRAAAPRARLVADANESWTPRHLRQVLPALAELGVELLEQPLPAGSDEALRDYAGPVLISADESCHDRSSLPDLAGKYSAITVKLDKTGGPTEAAALLAEARSRGFVTMLGCMVASSLSMAPGVLAAQQADVVHLDGPLLLTRDREPGLRYDGALVHPPTAEVWAG
ncbi:MAG TPA: N-acetyl-D-Glu racemase DgcA [Amycolatopsis sp.]|nr:N-acetyl-D-Glu racemase DgcA [Amycolatopsis sp.]